MRIYYKAFIKFKKKQSNRRLAHSAKRALETSQIQKPDAKNEKLLYTCKIFRKLLPVNRQNDLVGIIKIVPSIPAFY